jgi:hypothetical protein
MALNKTTTNAITDQAISSTKIEDGAITSTKISDATTISVSKTTITAVPPTITSLNVSQIDPSAGATVTITGTGFIAIPDVKFMNTTTGVRITPSAIGFTGSTQLTAAFPSGQTVGIYKVIVENPNGLSVLSTATITYSIAPAWATAEGSLGSFEEGDAINLSLLAYDDDSTAVTSYTLQSGSLPSGITLDGDSTIGSITGTAPNVDADTAFNFTIRAADNESQTSDRTFSMTITNWEVENSLRFNSGSSDYITRTPASASNREKWTLSLWVKRTNLSANDMLFYAHGGGSLVNLAFNGTDTLYMDIGGIGRMFETNAVFRDVSAWYHFVIAFNTTDYSTVSAGQVKVYVNGVEQTFLSTTNMSLGYDSAVNNTTDHTFGRDEGTNSNYANFYLSEINLIDGQQLDPTSFGETDATSGIWIPKKNADLSFGTNGFHLKFDNSEALGADSSGNGNNFTVNNLTAIDQTTDTPQNNFATMNPLASQAGSNASSTTNTFSDGNLTVADTASETAIGNLGVDTGKWFWEVKVLTDQDGLAIGGANQYYHLDAELGYNSPSSPSDAKVFGYYGGSGNKFITVGDGSQFTSYGSAIAVNDIVGVAMNLDDNEVTFYLNGTSQGTFSITALGSGEVYFPAVGNWSVATTTVSFNFGSPAFTISSGNSDANGYGNFEYAVPSGYYALNTKNLAEFG